MKEYSKLFDGQPASLNKIREENSWLELTVGVLISKGKVQGQWTLGLDHKPHDLILYPTEKIGEIPVLIKDGVVSKR